LFAARSPSLQLVLRAQPARDVHRALPTALAWSERINPMLEPDGEQALGDWSLHWAAVLVEPVHDGATGSMQPGLYQVGLYRLDLQLWRGGRLQREASLRRAGFRQVRQQTVP
jgi:general secretion pathway protein I